MSGHPVQFTPWGMVNHLNPVEAPPTDAERFVDMPETAAPAVIAPRIVAKPAVSKGVHASTETLTPKGVIKMAKARVRELRAEMKRMKLLEKELAALERLLTAAKRPIAAVRNIESRRTTA